MIFQAVVSFPKIVNILMNAAPDGIEIEEIKKAIIQIGKVENVHHIHLWCINEHDVALECHIQSADTEILPQVAALLRKRFGITHSNIQIEKDVCCSECDL